MKKNFNIILALDSENGLGKDGDLAWRISEDMKYFKEITTNTSPNLSSRRGIVQKNAVIMGRKTWDSIPEKYRPLPDRINCILSRGFKPHPSPLPSRGTKVLIGEGIKRFSNFDFALEKLSGDENIGEIFIIGGAQIYNLALKNPNLGKIYLTRVKGNFDCDVFVDLDLGEFEEVSIGEWKKNKKGIEFRFEVYKRK